MAFKSVAYQETLEAAGFPEAQAKAQAMEEFVVNELVTKEYLEHKLSDLKFELVKWIVGTRRRWSHALGRDLAARPDLNGTLLLIGVKGEVECLRSRTCT